ncbi:ubiquinone-dependent pyruvate dehydrogenase [Luteimicrobium xylanilyticum]|uniref:Pyruvate dehydrogenase [ubiquinone] n=1 Tax=Luteimicrobium xylanilyticum TaxID=1133546 RepID=A0A5P9QDD4_9MICO|nr:ubiquinone-dependent pyruvate dehydrogenase [Luteimicrobium xylanilyticum]QFU98485.1 Pyruvate dehydrogenase (quinone) [Luteimicrobium xylanilyticum]
MATTVADVMVSALKHSGVERVYGIPGDSLNGFVDALRRDGGVDWVHVRHEEAAAFAAAADAALTGELAVCVGSCGPGNTHLINGLYDAQRSGVPVLAIAAQIPGPEIGGEYFQETHPQAIFAECSVYTELVSTPQTAERIFEIAMRQAVERRGVAVVVVPAEVFLAKAPTALLQPSPIRAASPIVRPSEDELREAAGLLDGSSRVTILAGAGCAGARAEVLALAERIQAPIVHTLRGKEILEHDNPYDVGMTGLLGFASGYKAIAEADAVVLLGTDFPYRQFLPPGKTYVQVDVRGERLGRRAGLALGLVGTVRDTCAALTPLLRTGRDSHHLDAARRHYRHTRSQLDSFAVDDHNRAPIHPEYVARVLDDLADEDAVFTVDVGSPVVWAARYLRMNGARRLIGSFNHGTMANALPHAIGAQAAHATRQVITLSGDGGLAMLLGELLTLTQMDLPVKVVVFNNQALDFVEVEMKAAGIVNWGTELTNPDFAALAESVGLLGRRVTRPDDLEDALKEALAHPGPALVEVLTARQELSIPPAITAEQAKGFSLYAIRTILSGRGEELLDLVSTNVARRILR